MPRLTLEPVDAQGPQPAPVVQITERLPGQFRGGIEAMVDLAERNRVVRRVAHELLGQEIRVLTELGQAGLEPAGGTVASENPLDLIGPQIKAGNQIAEQLPLFERFQVPSPDQPLPIVRRNLEPGDRVAVSVEKGKE